MRSEKGGVPRRGTNCLGSVHPSQRRLSQNNYILKNCLVDFIGADSVGYLVGYKCVYHSLGSVSNSTPQEVDSPGFRFAADQARLLNKARNIAVLPRNRRFHGYQTNKHRRYMSGVARVSRRGLESYFRQYSPMEGFIQASHIVKINPRVNI
jgi:hypothetical protein